MTTQHRHVLGEGRDGQGPGPHHAPPRLGDRSQPQCEEQPAQQQRVIVPT